MAVVIPGFDPGPEPPDFIGPRPGPPAVALYVPHHRDPKMVGRVVERAPGVWIVYHESNGTQHHHKLRCLGGIDASVLQWMDRYGISEFHHEITQHRVDPVGLYMAHTDWIRQRGVLKTWDGRARWFLPTLHWTYAPTRVYAVPAHLPSLTLPEPLV